MSATVDLKLSLNGVTRRVPLPTSPAPTWSALQSLVLERFELATGSSIQLSFVDDDGDTITFSSDAELAELWAAPDATESPGFDDFKFVVVVKNATEKIDTHQLIGQVQRKLVEDPSFGRELMHAVRDARHGRRQERGFHPHAHGGRGGRRGGRGGRREGWGGGHGSHGHGHAPWEMRDFTETETSSLSSDDEEPKDPEEPSDPKVPKEKHRNPKHCQGKHSHHSHHAPPPPQPHFPHHGPPPFGSRFGAPFGFGPAHGGEPHGPSPFHPHGVLGPPPPPPPPFHSHFGRGGHGGGHHGPGRGGRHGASHGHWGMQPAPTDFDATFDHWADGPNSPGGFGGWGFGHRHA